MIYEDIQLGSCKLRPICVAMPDAVPNCVRASLDLLQPRGRIYQLRFQLGIAEFNKQTSHLSIIPKLLKVSMNDIISV